MPRGIYLNFKGFLSILFLLFFFDSNLKASSSLPFSVSELSQNSDALLKVKFLGGTEVRRLPNGQYSLWGTFEVLSSLSLSRRYIINHKNFPIQISEEFPSTQVGPQVFIQFDTNEEAFLFVKKGIFGISSSNFKNAKLEILGSENSYTKMVSVIGEGKIPYERFIANIEKQFNSVLIKDLNDLASFDLINPSQKRTPASFDDKNHEIEQPALSLFWLTALFIFIGLSGQFIFSKRR